MLEKVADYRDKRDRQQKLEEERRRQEKEKRRLEEEERKRLRALQDEELERGQSLIFNAERVKLSISIRVYINELQLRIQECGV